MTDDKGHSENLEDSIVQDPSIRKFFFGARLLDIFNNLIRYGAWLGIARYGYLSIDALAGETTSLRFLHVITFEVLSRSLPWWILTIALGFWAVKETREKKRKTEKLTVRIKELETILDPNRTSSGLLPSGDTHPDDDRT